MLLAPFSEFYGRKPVVSMHLTLRRSSAQCCIQYLISWGLFVIFQIPLAVAPNMGPLIRSGLSIVC
jgi:hypothetical protein